MGCMLVMRWTLNEPVCMMIAHRKFVGLRVSCLPYPKSLLCSSVVMDL